MPAASCPSCGTYRIFQHPAGYYVCARCRYEFRSTLPLHKVPRRHLSSVRHDLLSREEHICHYCGKNLHKRLVTVDHKHPRALGGHTTLDNLVVSCLPCNALKKTIPYEQFIAMLQWYAFLYWIAGGFEDERH